MEDLSIYTSINTKRNQNKSGILKKITILVKQNRLYVF